MIYFALSEVCRIPNKHITQTQYLSYANAIGDLEIIRQKVRQNSRNQNLQEFGIWGDEFFI